MEGLFDNPYIIFVLILFIAVRFFYALQENLKNKRPPQDIPPADTETFENEDYWNTAEQELGKEPVVEKNKNKEKRIIQEEEYFPFPQGLGSFATDHRIPQSAPLPKVRSVLVDIEKEKIENSPQHISNMQRPKNIHLNSAAAKPYSEPDAGLGRSRRQTSPLRKAVIWAEILGPPRGLKDF
jgi:hypothetical protein